MPRDFATCCCMLFVCCLCGCVPETQSAAKWDGTVRDSMGVSIVENFGAPLWTDETRWSVSELFRIGTVSGEPEYQFGSITGFNVLSDGRIVVADRMAQHLRFFSPEGEYEHTMGKAGTGPREFGDGALTLLRATGDTMLVVDWRNMQVHSISPDGRWLSSFSTRPEGGWTVRGWDYAQSGRVVSLMTEINTSASTTVDTMDVVVVRDVRGSVLDTLARVPATRQFQGSGEDPEWHFYGGRPDFDLTWDGGLVTGRSDDYRLMWYDGDGQLVRIVTLNQTRYPFRASDQTILEGMLDSLLHAWQVPPERITQLQSATFFEPTYPAFRRFVSGPEGSVWIQRVKPLTALSDEERIAHNPFRGPPGGDWEVFDGEGRYLGVVELPDRFLIGAFWRDRIYGIWRDELDVQYLMVLKLEADGEA